MRFTTVVSIIAFFTVASASALDDVCTGKSVISEEYIGESKDVLVQQIACDSGARLSARQDGNATNVCGTACGTSCFTDGTGPNVTDCTVIANALRYESQNTGTFFNITHGTANTVAMNYSSCNTFFVNQDSVDLTYCRTDWASLIDIVAGDCDASHSATGGSCIADDQRWFVEVARL